MARDLRRRRRRARARGHSSRQRAKHRGDGSRSRESDDDRSVLDRTHPFDRVGAIARAFVLPLFIFVATHRPAGVLYGKETPSSRHASTSLCDVHCDDSILTPTVRIIRASMYKENKEKKENIGHSESKASSSRDETNRRKEGGGGRRQTRARALYRGDDDGRRRR